MSWVLAISGFVLLIIIHELGHFIAAKAVGMRVERFSLFFGRSLFSVRRGETEYAVGMIPLGGYVKITGMNPYELEPEREGVGGKASGLAGRLAVGAPEALPPEVLARAYYRQPVWKRIVVIGAGPAMNLLTAFVLLFAVYHLHGFDSRPPIPVVGSIEKGTPAQSSLHLGDRLIAVDGHRGSVVAFTQAIAAHRCAGKQVNGCRAATPVQLTIVRNGKTLTIPVYPRYTTAYKPPRPRIGFGFAFSSKVIVVPQSISTSASTSVTDLWHATTLTVSKLSQIFTSSKARGQIHTVAGISDEVQQSFKFGIAAALSVLAFVSLSLAIINLFPFLPLDGGHIFWALAEKLRGRAIPVAVMERASIAGIALVLFIFLIGISNDVHTFTNGGFHVQ